MRTSDKHTRPEFSRWRAVCRAALNNMLFPGSFIPVTESVTAQNLIAGSSRVLTRRAFEPLGQRFLRSSMRFFSSPFFDRLYSPENEKVRQAVNARVRSSSEFDGVIDFDKAVRDPSHFTRLPPSYDSGDHLRVNDAGNVAQGNVIPLSLFHDR